MCGIVGLFLKNPDLRPSLGRHLSTMLIGMTPQRMDEWLQRTREGGGES